MSSDWSETPPGEAGEWIGYVRTRESKRCRIVQYVRPSDTQPWLEFFNGYMDTDIDAYEYGPRIPSPAELAAMREIVEWSDLVVLGAVVSGSCALCGEGEKGRAIVHHENCDVPRLRAALARLRAARAGEQDRAAAREEE